MLEAGGQLRFLIFGALVGDLAQGLLEAFFLAAKLGDALGDKLWFDTPL